MQTNVANTSAHALTLQKFLLYNSKTKKTCRWNTHAKPCILSSESDWDDN